MLGAMEQHRGVAIGAHHGNWLNFRKGAVMERLTYRTELGVSIDKNEDCPTCSICRNCDIPPRKCKYISDALEKLADYEDLEEQGRLVKLPCKVGDTVYVDNTILPIEDMECYEDIDNKIPLYFPARVVSFRFAKRNWMKIAVREKWLYEWIDEETGPDSNYIECEKNFTISLSNIGKTVFLTEAGAKLKELRGGEDEERS